MSIRNTKQLITDVQSNFDNYIITRSDIFYFVEFINFENELYNNNSVLTSKPNVIFYNENNIDKIILDYSQANNDDKTYLKTFFINMQQGTGISLTDCNYLDESVSSTTINLESNIEFVEFKNDFLFGKVISTEEKYPSVDVYMNTFFINTPQITSGLSLSNDTTSQRNAIVFIPVGNKILKNLGFYPGDLIEIKNPKSQNRDIKFQIIDTVILNKKEVILLKQKTVVEKLIGQPTIVNLYQTQLAETTVSLDINEIPKGSCLKLGTTIKYSTKYQCEFRGGNYFI